MSPFWFVDVLVSPFWLVAVLVCRRFDCTPYYHCAKDKEKLVLTHYLLACLLVAHVQI